MTDNSHNIDFDELDRIINEPDTPSLFLKLMVSPAKLTVNKIKPIKKLKGKK